MLYQIFLGVTNKKRHQVCVGKQQQQHCGANGFSSSRYTKLLWPQTGAAQTLLFNIWNFFPSPSVLFLFLLPISSPPLPLCCWFFFSLIEGRATHCRPIVVKAPVAKYRHLFSSSCARSGAAYFTTHDMVLLAWPHTDLPPPLPPPVWFHWCMYTLGDYYNGGCHHQSESHVRDFVSYQTLDCCGSERAGRTDITANMLLLRRRQNVDIWLVSAEGLTSLRKWQVSHLLQSFLLL